MCRGMGAINTALFLCTKSRSGFWIYHAQAG
nr:MAG TPA: hypothetical protein [Caudoviricetes sp.]DAO27713.1 MAG TPA: hypothetical protein [Caudoviricetes sp.]